jgi:hypothetical protein
MADGGKGLLPMNRLPTFERNGLLSQPSPPKEEREKNRSSWGSWAQSGT